MKYENGLTGILRDIERLELQYHYLGTCRNMYDYCDPDEIDDYYYYDNAMEEVDEELCYLEEQLSDYYKTKGID